MGTSFPPRSFFKNRRRLWRCHGLDPGLNSDGSRNSKSTPLEPKRADCPCHLGTFRHVEILVRSSHDSKHGGDRSTTGRSVPRTAVSKRNKPRKGRLAFTTSSTIGAGRLRDRPGAGASPAPTILSVFDRRPYFSSFRRSMRPPTLTRSGDRSGSR